MSRALRISIAEDEKNSREFFRALLVDLGHEVVSVASSGRELVEHCRRYQPDLVISDVNMPEMDGIGAAQEIYRDRPVPVILISACYEAEVMGKPQTEHILAYLVKPVKHADLEPAIAIAMSRFEQLNVLQKDAHDLRQALSDRNVIEQAKGILMRKAHLDEHNAFRRLQKLAREQSRKMVDIAHMIVTADAALEPRNA